MRSSHYFYENTNQPIAAEIIEGDDDDDFATLILWIGDVRISVMLTDDAFARAQRIADAINEGGRADAAPVA